MSDLTLAVIRSISRIIARSIDRSDSAGSAETFRLLTESSSFLDTETSLKLRTE